MDPHLALRADAAAVACSDRGGRHPDAAPEIVARVASPVSGMEILPIRRAAGRILAGGVSSAIPLPPFDHSAVDGYALRSRDVTHPETVLPVAGRVVAGESGVAPAGPSAVRVMTGAPIPPGYDAVVKQEIVRAGAGLVTIPDAVRRGANIRRAGEDVARGDGIVPAGTLLDARHIALLAACGVDRVPVVRRLRIAIAVFGRELRRPGAVLHAAQIYDSNTAMAAAFLARPSCRLVATIRTGDDRAETARLLAGLADRADLIVTSGGMAGGDEDHTRPALEEAGGHWQEVALAMKPGKPARLGRLGEAVVLGLPGNPFAALVAMIVLGLPLLGALTGNRSRLEWLSASAGFDWQRSPGRTEFFPASVDRNHPAGGLRLQRLGKGGSARLHPLVHADGLGRVEAGAGTVAPGDGLLFLPFSSMLG